MQPFERADGNFIYSGIFTLGIYNIFLPGFAPNVPY